jgi:PAS domain-containing protein
MGASPQRPLQLIQARNLLSCLSTPGLLVNQPGDVIYYNDPAGAVLGQRFEETGTLSAHDWVCTFGPFDEDGEPLPIERQPLTAALRANRPAHAVHRIRSATGAEYEIAVSGVPIVGGDGFEGAMVFFWEIAEGRP